MKEVTVILKDEDKTIKHKFMIYEEFFLSVDNDLIKNCIAEAKKNFDGEPESITVKASLEVR